MQNRLQIQHSSLVVIPQHHSSELSLSSKLLLFFSLHSKVFYLSSIHPRHEVDTSLDIIFFSPDDDGAPK
jgi:hypothetical protein